MNNTVPYVSSDILLSEFGVKYSESFSNFDEDIAKIYLDEGIDKLLTADSLNTYVSFLSLNSNGKVKLPNNFKNPIQIAYRDTTDPGNFMSTRTSVVEYIERSLHDHCDIKVSIDCDKCKSKKCKCTDGSYPIELDVTQTILGAHPELQIGYNRFLIGYSSFEGYNYRSNIHKGFTLIRPTSSYFFNLPQEIQGCQIPNLDNFLEYDINDGILEVNNGILRNYPYGEIANIVSKDCSANRTGEVLISYIGTKMDSKGFLMIPKLSCVFIYLNNYLLEAFCRKRYLTDSNSNNRTIWMDMKSETQRSFATANSELRIPDKVRWEEILRNTLLKRKTDFKTNSSGNYTYDRADYTSHLVDPNFSKISTQTHTQGLQTNYFSNYGMNYGR